MAAVGLGLTGCTASTAQSAPVSSAGAAAPAASGAFTAHTVTGGQVVVPGSKPTVLFFFSVGCGSCGPESAALAGVQNAAPQAANYVAVDVAPSETVADITAFLAQNHASSLAYASDSNAQLISAYQVQDLSSVVVINRAGTVVFRGVEPSAGQIRDAVTKAGS
ncbi:MULTISPECIES: peroxiredoxin family protein [Actinomycetes]|uniref:peroxiredoxin family protein n=1 Tax=Actinomycetes TaxID=1760 RepID=UPI00389A8CE6